MNAPSSHDPVDQRVHDLFARLDSPRVPISDDLVRGRRRLRRRRGAAAAGLAAVLAVAVPVGVDLAGAQPSSSPDAASAVVIRGAELGLDDVRELPSTRVDDEPFEFAFDDPSTAPAKVAVRAAIARDLDPAGRHLLPATVQDWRGFGADYYNGYTDPDDAVTTWFQNTLDWTGEDGLVKDAVTVDVNSVRQLDCGGTWKDASSSCTRTTLAGLPVLEVTDFFGPLDDAVSRTYFHERGDGYTVTVQVHDGVDVTDAQLADLLTDPEVDIPGHPTAPRYVPLPGTTSRDVARDVLGDRLGKEGGWDGDVGGYYAAELAGGVGQVDVQHLPGAGRLLVPCGYGTRQTCIEGTLDGRRLRIDYYGTLDEADGGYVLTFEGPTRTIEVKVDADDRPRSRLPEDYALRIATDPRLQQ